MMRPKHEYRVDGAVDPGSLGIGETVEVRTLMGAFVARGDVDSSTPFGVILKEGNIARNFFSRDFYLFIPEEQQIESVAVNMVTDSHPDSRVLAKLGVLEQGDGTNDAPESDGDEASDSGDEEDGAGVQDGDDGQQGGQIDVDNLPPEIKRAVQQTGKLDMDQVNYVLSQVGSSLLGALRRSGIVESELHGMVQKAQNAIYKILTGKSARNWKSSAGVQK